MRTRLVLIVLLAAYLTASSFGQVAVVNGASFAPGKAVAPGSIASAFGDDLCGETMNAGWVEPGRLPTSLGDCEVAVNGIPAMLLYVSRRQINFVVPPDAFPGRAEIRVRNQNEFRYGYAQIEEAAPGVFARNGMGLGEGAILHGSLWRSGPFSAVTDGAPTPLSIFLTGMDTSEPPGVSIAGVPVRVTYYGPAPGFVGLQQVNIELPPEFAGAGCVPLTVRSRDRISNVTEITLLPNSAQMQGMPGWGPGSVVKENEDRGQEPSALAYDATHNHALVTDEEGDIIRVISLDTKNVVATLALPEGSAAKAISVNRTGTIAAAALSGISAVALVDLTDYSVSIVQTNHYPCRLAFHGSQLLVTNAASGTVTVIDTTNRTVSRIISAEFGACGIAVAGYTAVVANQQSESISLINLIDFSVATIELDEGMFPKEVAISESTMKGVITLPMTNAFLIFDLPTKGITTVETEFWSALGPGSVVADGNRAYIANRLSASVTVADITLAKVVTTFSVNPGPRDLALNRQANELLVLSQATGTLSIVDLESFAIVDQILAVEADPQGHGWKHRRD